MIFAWDDWNRKHLAKHHVSPDEAEEIIAGTEQPFPMEIGDEELLVWGQTDRGRYLQVVYVLERPHEVEYEGLSVEEWIDVEAHGEVEIVRIIHAMDLTPTMKKRLRKLQR